MKIIVNVFWLVFIIVLNMVIYNWHIKIFELKFWNFFTVVLGGGLGVISVFIFFLFQVVLEKKIKSKYVLFFINLILASIITLSVFFITFYIN